MESTFGNWRSAVLGLGLTVALSAQDWLSPSGEKVRATRMGFGPLYRFSKCNCCDHCRRQLFRDDWIARGKSHSKRNSSKVAGLPVICGAIRLRREAMADRSTGVFPGDGKMRGANNAPRIRFHN